MFTKQQLAKWRSEGFIFPEFYDEVAVDEKKKEFNESNKKKQKYILDENDVAQENVENSIIVDGIKYDLNEISNRVNNIKNKIKSFYDELSDEEKLIIDLPIIQWNLNYKHGAVMIIHWLEGSKKSIKLSYDFFMSENRVKDIDKKNLELYLKEIKYLSIESIGYYPSNPDGLNFFLFNDSIPSIKKSLDLFYKKIKKLTKNSNIGNFDDLSTHIDEKVKVKDNFFQSFSIGSSIGNFDDIGTALGRYSYRVYFKGFLSKDEISEKWVLDIEAVGGRFIDEFSFNDNIEFLNPTSWKSQSLGCWKNSLKDPSVSRLKTPLISDKICLENKDFKNLKIKALKKGILIGGDFLIYSNIKVIKDEFVKKTIII